MPFQKYTFSLLPKTHRSIRVHTTVHINTICMCFRFDPLLRPLANRCVFDENAQRVSVDGGPQRIGMDAFSSERF